MKSKILGLVIGILAAAQISTAQQAATGIAKAKAIELTAHRIDRLVSLNKIDASFLSKTAKMELSIIENQVPAYFKVRVSQTQPASGEALQMDVVYDVNGKPLSFNVLPGGNAGPDDGWTGVDAVTLIENGLHYVLENGETDAQVKPFYTALTTIALTKGQLDGKPVALIQMKSSESTLTLNVYVNFDGTFISTEFIK